MPAGRTVQVAGLKVIYQAPPTAHGVRFLSLEDEAGLINVVISQDVYTQYRHPIRQAALLLLTGVVQRRDGVTNVVARRVARVEAKTAD